MIKHIIIALFLLGIGIILYPFLIDMTDALYSVAQTLLPAMPDTSHFFFRIIPLLFLYIIVYGAILKIIGRGSRNSGGSE